MAQIITADTEDLNYAANDGTKRPGLARRVFNASGRALTSKTGTFVIGAGASAAVSIAIRSSVFGLSAFAGLGAVTVGGIAVVPVAAAALAGAGTGTVKWYIQNRKDRKAGVAVSHEESMKRLKKQLLMGSFLGFAGGAATQGVLEYVLPNPYVQTAWSWVKDFAAPYATPVVSVAKETLGAVGATFAPAYEATVGVVKSFGQSTASFFAETKSFFSSGWSKLTSLFSGATPPKVEIVRAPAVPEKPVVQDIAPVQTVAPKPAMTEAEISAKINQMVPFTDQELSTLYAQSSMNNGFIDLKAQTGTDHMREQLVQHGRLRLQETTPATPGETTGTIEKPVAPVAEKIAAPVVTPEISLAEKLAGHVNGKRISKTVRALIESAEQGNAQAQKDLAVRLLNGTGIPRSETLAVEAYRAAAALGNAQAKVDLAYLQYHGKHGIPADPQAAIESLQDVKTKAARAFARQWASEQAALPQAKPVVELQKPVAPVVKPVEAPLAAKPVEAPVVVKTVPVPTPRPADLVVPEKAPVVAVEKPVAVEAPVVAEKPVVTVEKPAEIAAIKPQENIPVPTPRDSVYPPCEDPMTADQPAAATAKPQAPVVAALPPSKIPVPTERPAYTPQERVRPRAARTGTPSNSFTSAATECSIQEVYADGTPKKVVCRGGAAATQKVGSVGSFPFRLIK